MKIEVVYARPTEQVVVELELPAGTTANQALQQSGLLQRFIDIDAMTVALGVFGERVTREHALVDGDRLEIYRALLADPKEARRRRARARRR